MRVDREVVRAPGSAAELGERCIGDVNNRPAVRTDEVRVAVLAKVIKGWPDAGMDTSDDLEFVEPLQHPVDGRRCDPRPSTLDLRDQIVSREMPIGSGENGDEQPGRHGESAAGPADQSVDPVLVHGRRGRSCPSLDAMRAHGVVRVL